MNKELLHLRNTIVGGHVELMFKLQLSRFTYIHISQLAVNISESEIQLQ